MKDRNNERLHIRTSAVPNVSKADMIRAFQEVGVAASDTVLIHSSLKSFGHVIGGPLSVIDAIKETVTESGTVVFPTLVQRDFANAYRHWDIRNSPSDVGNITETFRLLPDSIRSDQATHSVAAWGSRAAEITGEHAAYGPRMGVFGDYCFSYSSPWQKMYLHKARIVFIGIDMVYNTFKHFAEYALVEHYCSAISDPGKKCSAMSKIARHNIPGVWPFHDAAQTQSMLDELGVITYAKCGNSLFTSVKANDYVDNVLRAFKSSPQKWFDDAFLSWLENEANG
ncbi:AAC(3) family N-acetyltransferase [Paenibacillus sp. MBLB4367]|uniref:AAC(3) family N-acetyltransferase n=1 Tax=Paenibacillus sp. MBLB4367 TaxID=3384767 RepID=UPI0039081F3E